MSDLMGKVLALVLSAVLGGVIGYEREMHEHPAGLRTHILVCIGATLMTIVSASFRPPVGDPTRIAAQIVSGIGFLGAGTILRRGNMVHGLTTAASLWVVAGIGMMVGAYGVFSMYSLLAILATGIVFVILSVMRRIEPSLVSHLGHELVLEMSAEDAAALADVLHGLTEMGISVRALQTSEPSAPVWRAFRLVLSVPRKTRPESIIRFLARQEKVSHFDWR